MRAAPTLKNCVFCIYLIFFPLQNCLICLVLNIGSMLVFFVLKNAVECTSQRLKWASGARVIVLPLRVIILRVIGYHVPCRYDFMVPHRRGNARLRARGSGRPCPLDANSGSAFGSPRAARGFGGRHALQWRER